MYGYLGINLALFSILMNGYRGGMIENFTLFEY